MTTAKAIVELQLMRFHPDMGGRPRKKTSDLNMFV